MQPQIFITINQMYILDSIVTMPLTIVDGNDSQLAQVMLLDDVTTAAEDGYSVEVAEWRKSITACKRTKRLSRKVRVR